jgi:hypothetical protein
MATGKVRVVASSAESLAPKGGGKAPLLPALAALEVLHAGNRTGRSSGPDADSIDNFFEGEGLALMHGRRGYTSRTSSAWRSAGDEARSAPETTPLNWLSYLDDLINQA